MKKVLRLSSVNGVYYENGSILKGLRNRDISLKVVDGVMVLFEVGIKQGELLFQNLHYCTDDFCKVVDLADEMKESVDVITEINNMEMLDIYKSVENELGVGVWSNQFIERFNEIISDNLTYGVDEIKWY